MRWIRSFALFAAGVAVGSLFMPAGSAQGPEDTGLRLDHVAIAVSDVQQSLDFYTKVMGFRAAFSYLNAEGTTTTFLQINRGAFLEVTPASATVPPGITHIGIQSQDESATIARLRQSGANSPGSDVSSTKEGIIFVTAPDNIRLELIFKPFLEERIRAGVWNARVLLRELRADAGGYTRF